MMLIVGLTGGFGSGKSFVASIFKKLGARVIDADKLGHEALRKGSRVYKRVLAAFGDRILDDDRSINRRVLARIAFRSKKSIAKLNRLVQPEIISSIKERIKKAAKNEILMVDAPLICETNITGLMNYLIVVKASKKKQVERAARKFNIDEKDVCKRMACQMPLCAKIRMADYMVNNNGTKKGTEKQVRKIWQELKKGA